MRIKGKGEDGMPNTVWHAMGGLIAFHTVGN
jgi:hypothetical protein